MSRIEHHLLEIERRKERLIARAQAQRWVIGQSVRQLHGPIAIADRGLAVGRYFRSHPVLIAVAVAALVALRGRGVLALVGRAFSLWRLWRSLTDWSSGRSV